MSQGIFVLSNFAGQCSGEDVQHFFFFQQLHTDFLTKALTTMVMLKIMVKRKSFCQMGMYCSKKKKKPTQMDHLVHVRHYNK